MAENKTKPTTQSVIKFINSIDDETRRKDSLDILKLMKQITKEEPQMGVLKNPYYVVF